MPSVTLRHCGWNVSANEGQLEAAKGELQELYRRLELARPMSRERIVVQMQIARVRRRIGQLERNQPSPSG